MSKEQTTKNHLEQVSKDISNLRSDLALLLTHTGRNAIPHGARELAVYSKDRLHAGGEFAASQLRYLRAHPGQSSAGILGGLVLLGAVAAGIYYLCKSDCGKRCSNEEEPPDFDPSRANNDLPPYIS